VMLPGDRPNFGAGGRRGRHGGGGSGGQSGGAAGGDQGAGQAQGQGGTAGGPSPQMRAARQALMQACQADIASLCAGQEGREAFMCLRQNADKASPGCKAALAKAPHRPQAAAGGDGGGDGAGG